MRVIRLFERFWKYLVIRTDVRQSVNVFKITFYWAFKGAA